MSYNYYLLDKAEITTLKEMKGMAIVDVKNVLNLVSELLDVPWTSCDKKTDDLYINFKIKKPGHTDDTRQTEEDLIVRYDEGEIVGIYVLNARRRFGHGHAITYLASYLRHSIQISQWETSDTSKTLSEFANKGI